MLEVSPYSAFHMFSGNAKAVRLTVRSLPAEKNIRAYAESL